MNYQLKSIGKNCEESGETLTPGTTCHSVLVERDGKLVRLDFAEEHWNGPPNEAIGCWQTIVPEPETGKPKPLDQQALLQCFETMCEDANPAHDKLRYVLSLLLVQKRQLKIDATRQEDEITFLELIGRQGEGPFEVREYELTADEMQQLQIELTGQLGQNP